MSLKNYEKWAMDTVLRSLGYEVKREGDNEKREVRPTNTNKESAEKETN